MNILNNLLSPLNALANKTDPEKGAALVGINNASVKDFIDLSTLNFGLVASAKACEFLKVGDKITILERASAVFDVVFLSSVSADEMGIIACTGVSNLALKLRNDAPHVYPEWFGAIGNGGLTNPHDDGPNLLAAIATKKKVILDPKKIYATASEIALKNSHRLHGGTRSYLDENNASAIKWIGENSPVVAVVYMAQNDTRYTTNSSSVAYAECVDVLIDGNKIADVGFYSNYTSSGTRILNVYAKNTLKCAILVTGCFYTEIDRLTGRGNEGAGVAIGNYTQTGLMTVTDPVISAINALGDVNIESHSNGKDLAWDHSTNNYVGFGLGLFGTINKCKFTVTSELNQGSAILEEVNQGEFDIYAYVEGSAKNNANPGKYSVQLLGSPSINSKSTVDILLRTNQRIDIVQSSRNYYLKLDGGDNGVGINENGATNYNLDPKSRFNFINDYPRELAFDRVVDSGIISLNSTSSLNAKFYLKESERTLCTLRLVMLDNVGGSDNFNVRVKKNGDTVTTKGINLDNKNKYDVIEQTLIADDGFIELSCTQSIGANADAFYQVVLREVTTAAYK
jgi:hypothetical protein